MGSLTSSLLGRMGSGDFARAMAAELVSRLPLPIDAKIIATARGLQASGIVLCLANGTEMTRCQCFIDLALSQTRERLGGILTATTANWAGLQAFRPDDH